MNHVKFSEAKFNYNTDSFKHVDPYKGLTKNTVIMFGAGWCGYCRKAREYFNARNIIYTDYDIEKDSHAKQLYTRPGVYGVPVILVGKMEMLGFSASAFERIYKHK